MGIPVLRGRNFSEVDREGSLPVAIINEELADRFWSGEDPIGKRLRLGETDEVPWLTVVGIVRNARGFTLQQRIEPEVYLPYRHNPPSAAYIMVRSSGEMESTVRLLRSAIAAIDPNQPVETTTMDVFFTRSVAQPRLRMLLLTSFAALALALAAVGIYGVMSYFVNERIREIGVRMALGARKEEVLWLVMKRGIVLILSGLCIGLPAAAGLSRALASLLFGVAGTDWGTYAIVSCILVAFSLAAIYVPAKRATRVDPIVALRHE
jgi:putative ABC transport system permease protein